MKSDNLFDTKFSFLDFVKIMLLVVTGFSTYNIVDVFTPDGSLDWIRKWAAVLVVEGAFVGFEWATANAKCRRQVTFATVGFFCSLVVIGLFAGASGLLEFGGKNLVDQPFGTLLGLSLTFGDAISGGALTILVIWILTLASIYRFYSLNDPDAKAEIERNVLYEDMANEDTAALRTAYKRAAPVVASNRALANIQDRFKGELGEAMMGQTLDDVRSTLAEKYQREVDLPTAPQEAAPSLRQRVTQALRDKAKTFITPHTDTQIEADPRMPIIPKYEATTVTPTTPAQMVEDWIAENRTESTATFDGGMKSFEFTLNAPRWWQGHTTYGRTQEIPAQRYEVRLSEGSSGWGGLNNMRGSRLGNLTPAECGALKAGRLPDTWLETEPTHPDWYKPDASIDELEKEFKGQASPPLA